MALSIVAPPEYDDLGRMKKMAGDDLACEGRDGVAKALGAIAELLDESQVADFFALMVPAGLRDREPRVREGMLEAAVRTVEVHGEENVEALVLKLEEEMDKKYGARSGKHGLRPRRERSYAHLHTTITDGSSELAKSMATPQMSINKGIRVLGEDGVNAVRKEVTQLHERQVMASRAEVVLTEDRKGSTLAKKRQQHQQCQRTQCSSQP